MIALQRRLDVALQLAERAGALAMSLRPPPGAAQGTLKSAQDWLTEADGAVEAFLSRHLAEAFPGDGFQGEEGGDVRPGALRWVVDPIDGTSNFARGASRWCVSLGLVGEGRALLGVLAAPALGEVFAARDGGGASLNGVPIRAAETRELPRAIVEVGWSPRRPNPLYYAMTQKVMDAGAMLRAGGSGAMGLADVAAGRMDAYVEVHINLWDVAAGLSILAEAGAVTSDFLAGDGARSGNPILAAAPGIGAAMAGLSGIAIR